MRIALLFAAVILLPAQGLRTSSADYPVRIQLDTVTIAADYLVHSLPTTQGTLVANDYLVVEIALFGPPLSRLKVSPDQFTLRVNGHGTPLPTQLPGMVAGSIKFPNSSGRGFTGSGTVNSGNGTVGIGPRAPRSRFPGDGNDRTSQPVTTVQKEQEDSIDTRVQNASLPEGEQSLPRSGLIYFPHRGRTKSIHSLELFYDGPMGKASLKLLP